jgi:hypothetical protein
MLEYGQYIIFDNKEEFLQDWTVSNIHGCRYNGYRLMDKRNPNNRRYFDNETIKDYIEKTPFAIKEWCNENGCGYVTISLDDALLTMLRKTNRQLKKLQEMKEEVLERLGVDN